MPCNTSTARSHSHDIRSLLARAVRLCARRGKLNLEGAVPPASDALSRIQACNAIDARITCSALPDSATSSVPAMLQALSVPHSWFSHFYLVGNVCNCALACHAASWLLWTSNFVTSADVILQLATHLQFQIGAHAVVDKLVEPCPHLTRFAAWPGTLYVLALFQVHLIRRGLERHAHWCHHRRPSLDVD